MGLAQFIKFNYNNRTGLEKILLKLGFKRINGFYEIKNEVVDFVIKIENNGVYIHKSGKYFELFGKLIEELGNISSKIVIEDF